MGVLKVRVNGAWEDISSANEPPLDEVWVGAGPPDPVGTYELWVDNTVIPPILHFKDASGAWDVVSGNEVVVGTTDPFTINPESTAELWHDLTLGQSGKLKARWGGQWHPIAEFTESEVEIGSTDPTTFTPPGTTELWVDTSTTPVVLKAWVNGAWVDAGSASTGAVPEEVNIGPVEPRDVTVELWYDNTLSPGTLFANNNGVWEPITGAEEVAVGVNDPRVTDPASAVELWYDTGSGVPGVLNAWVNDQWIPVVNYATSVAFEQQYGQEPRAGTLRTVAHEDHSHGTPPEEVSVGAADPATANPDIELWYDTDATVVSTTDARLLTQRIVALEGRLALLEARLVQAGDVLDGPN